MKSFSYTFIVLLAASLWLSCNNSQEPESLGCTDPQACNYDTKAEEDDGSCLYDDCLGVCGGTAVIDCTGICGGSYQLDSCGDCLHPENQADIWNSSCSGCMDPEAANYDMDAILDDGSCIETFPDGWTLVWNDEFTAESIDGSNWSYEIWAPYYVNNELQAYTDRPENAYIDNGHLVIRGLRENYQGPGYTADYTSARLHTAGKAEFQYGRFDIRAKLPMGQGTWPAIWMLGSNIGWVGWPACGEIDIMEHVNTSSHVSSSIHTPECYHALDGYPGTCTDYNITCPGGCVNPLPNTYGIDLDDPGDWHVYGMIWTEDSFTFTVDDQPFMSLSRPISGGDLAWPFDQPAFLILNLALGGDWPGNPDDNIFPITFEIDYIRVYSSDE